MKYNFTKPSKLWNWDYDSMSVVVHPFNPKDGTFFLLWTKFLDL